LVAMRDLKYYQFDFKTTFLNTTIPEGEEYYIQPLEGLRKPYGMVYKLKRALYGLRQSPIYWLTTVKPVMENLGFKALNSDVCLFKHREVDILVVLYVDDLLVAVPTVTLINRIYDSLKAKFELKEIGEVKRFLSFNILRDRSNRKIFIS